MIVFPLKWLPWILVIVGFLALVTAGDAVGLIPLGIGGIWLYLKYKDKPLGTPRSSSGSTYAYKAPAQNTSASNASSGTGIANSADTAASADPSVCPNCKTPVGAGMSFCNKCGTKVR